MKRTTGLTVIVVLSLLCGVVHANAQPYRISWFTADAGGGNTTITSMDPDGVALAAIQGLNQKLEREAKEKDAEIQALKQRLEDLEALLRR